MGETSVLAMNEHAARYESAGPLRPSRASLRWKRPLDVAISAAVLLLSAPLLAVLALLLKLESPGPAFFRQERVGYLGRRFEIWKLRTMYIENDERAHRRAAASWFSGLENGKGYKTLSDSRITPIGRFLRRTSLDEIPQMLNVLRGEMSVVGPRPAIPYELDLYEPEYFCRQEVPPGITGLWQVSGRERLSAKRMMELDLEYVRRASLWMDLKIMLLTGPAVVSSFLKIG
jgi:lipopolysaccharide/colanic/teichoic acid biosynthesis glycosyltransferase